VIEPPSSEEGVFIEPPTSPRVEREAPRGDDTTRQTLDAQLMEFRGEFVQASRGSSRLQKGTPGAAHLSRELHLDHELCEEMLHALDERGRLMLVGPPASGKTHVARRLAIHVAGHDDRVLYVRFHPDLSYADLIDGPGGAGIVRAHCEQAQRDHDRKYALVLDELDRGDAARALGEFLGGLTEPGHDVRLARSGVAFHVPRNLRVIATARQLPHDPALIARFPLVRQPADPQILRRFLEHCGRELSWVPDMLEALNKRLAQQERPQRVGHGLLMDPALDVARLQRIWRHEILPLLECQGVDTSGLDYASLRP
jgi:5-methylcytosine-specific restriction protein B